jgi:PAS domain S-box-containing protein
MSRPPPRDRPDSPDPLALAERDGLDDAVRDPARLEAVRATGLLDTPPEAAFDRLARMAVRLLRVPASFLSLVDEGRDFYKAGAGLPEPLASARELAGRTFCHFTVGQAERGRPLVIPDTRADPVYREVPTVESLGVAAYLGIPLVVDGEAIGSFCAIDTVPRDWTDDEVEVLAELATSAQREIELRRALAEARRRAEETERTVRERDALLDATTDGIYTVDRNGRILFANRAAAEQLGWSAEEMAGREGHALFHHSYPDGTPYPREKCPIWAAADSGHPVQMYGEVLWRRDGTSFPVSYASAPVHHGGGVVGAVVRFTDVTEQRRLLEGLQLLAESGRVLSSSLEVEETLKAVARLAAPQVAEIVMVDVIEDGVVRRVSASHADSRAAALLEEASRFPPRLDDGGPQAQVMESGTALIRNDLDDAWIRTLNRGEEHQRIVRELAPRSLMVVPLRSRGEVMGTVSFVRGDGRPPFDEADLELAEELARRAALAMENARLYDDARRATRARDDMLAVVSHDLRNPIHSVFMSSSFLLDLLPAEGMEVERTQAAVIKRAAERGNRLIQDLLDITHIESGRLSLVLEDHRAASLAREAVEQAGFAAANQGIALVRGEMDDTARVCVDHDRILQALGNLIGNALKFTPSGGRVTIAVRRDGDDVLVSVADTGPGVDAAQLPRLFDRYWQANRRDKRGVGLGLSIVKGIMEAHGGEVRVDSHAGVGTTFTLVLPALVETAG